MKIARRAVIAMPYYDTPENDRAKHTIKAVGHLADILAPPHELWAIDNGSTDKAATKWIQERSVCNLGIFKEPHSIAHAVNWAWHKFEAELDTGNAIAMKHDSDLIVEPQEPRWINSLLHLVNTNPEVYIAGPRRKNHDYLGSDWVHKDHEWWFESPFVYGGVQARSPIAWEKLGYSRQPYGRWGWGDHWDAFRADYLGGKMAVLWDYEFIEITDESALGQAYKLSNHDKARDQFGLMKEDVKNGVRPIRESDYDTDVVSAQGKHAGDNRAAQKSDSTT